MNIFVIFFVYIYKDWGNLKGEKINIGYEILDWIRRKLYILRKLNIEYIFMCKRDNII